MEKILIVDDEKHIRYVLKELLEDNGYRVFEAQDASSALEKIKTVKPVVILLDFKLPDINADKLLKKIKSENNRIKVIIFTAYADIKKAVICMKNGAYDYITKPFDNNEILLIVKKAIKEYQMENEIEILRKKVMKNEITKNMMGESEAIKKVIEQIDLVAPTDMSVLLQGETGTGKEVVSKLIHSFSNRAKNPFIPVDCGSIPENLFESEIFGYEKGAFTGASRRYKGKFEMANNGTLFLDEITNLPLNMQAKLLRVIQEKKLMRLGGNTFIPVNVRIIAASNKSLEELIKQGKFRDDLYFRLNEYKIEIPPLRERKTDIPFFINMFIKEFSAEFKKNIKNIEKDALKLLMEYNWPGNIRELRNIIKRAVLTAENEKIIYTDLIFLQNNKNDIKEFSNFEEITKFAIEQKVKIIKREIQKAEGNKSIAAKNLNITRNQLYRILNRAKELGIIV